MIVYQLSVCFILIISNALSEVSVNTSVTLSFAIVLELFLQTFDRFFVSRFTLMSYLIVQEGTTLRYLKMPVHAVQYR